MTALELVADRSRCGPSTDTAGHALDDGDDGDASVVTPLDRWLADQQQLTPVERFSRAHDAGHTGETDRWRDLLPASPPGAGQQYAFDVDLDACTGCKSCVAACHSLNGLDDGETWRAVGLLVGEAEGAAGACATPTIQHVTTACHHCLDPGCLSGCPVDAYEKDAATGIVRHLDDQCIGCQYCTLMCPYEVPTYHAALGIVRKCDLCADRLTVGEAPACAQACPTEAIRVGVVTVEDVRRGLASAAAEALVPTAPASRLTAPTTQYRSARGLSPNLRAADEGELVPAHAHPPLVVMLVLTQLAVGLAGVGVVLRAVAPSALTDGLDTSFTVTTAVTGILALGASTLHLGRPAYAWRAVVGLGHSWLSREIVAFGAFAAVACAVALGHATRWADPGLAGDAAVAGTGAVGVACSAAVYAATGKRWWRLGPTLWRFALTMASTAGATASMLIAIAVATGLSEATAARGTLLVLFVVSLSALLGSFATDLLVRRHRAAGVHDELARTAHLLAGPLRGLGGLRLGLAAAAIALRLVSVALVTGVGADAPGLPGVLVVAVGFVVVAELVGRHMWFLAVSSARMPGMSR
jgi:formate dehydrogenase iron-sulfur subunit